MLTHIKSLKTAAHALKPVVWLGQHGLTDAVMAEVEAALNAHELIKIKIPGEDRDARKASAADIAARAQAELVQIVGHVATFYRKKARE